MEQKVEVVTKLGHTSIKQDMFNSIENKKAAILRLADKRNDPRSAANSGWDKFQGYTYNFANNNGRAFLETPKEDRLL